MPKPTSKKHPYAAARDLAARRRSTVPGGRYLRKANGEANGEWNGSLPAGVTGSNPASARPRPAPAPQEPHWSELPPQVLYDPANPEHYPCHGCAGTGWYLRLRINTCFLCRGTGINADVKLTAYAIEQRRKDIAEARAAGRPIGR